MGHLNVVVPCFLDPPRIVGDIFRTSLNEQAVNKSWTSREHSVKLYVIVPSFIPQRSSMLKWNLAFGSSASELPSLKSSPYRNKLQQWRSPFINVNHVKCDWKSQIIKFWQSFVAKGHWICFSDGLAMCEVVESRVKRIQQSLSLEVLNTIPQKMRENQICDTCFV